MQIGTAKKKPINLNGNLRYSLNPKEGRKRGREQNIKGLNKSSNSKIAGLKCGLWTAPQFIC